MLFGAAATEAEEIPAALNVIDTDFFALIFSAGVVGG